MSFPRSLEKKILLFLACSRTVGEPGALQKLVRFNLDWGRILEKAEQLGIAPLIYSALKKVTDSNQIPKEIMEQLQASCARNTIRNMDLYRKLKEILVTFSQEEIPVIVLKGAALAELVYQNIALRPMADLDLLVKKEDLDAAEHLLLKLDYVPYEPSFRPREWFPDHHHHLAPYISPNRSFFLELHHHIIPPPASASLPIHDFWHRALPAQIASTPSLVFAPQDMLLHLCLHLSHPGCLPFVGNFRVLCDIAETIRRYQAEIDWAQFLRAGQIYEVEKFLYYALWLAQDMVEAEVPTELLEELESALRGRGLEDIGLKFLIRRAIFVTGGNQAIPPWVIHETCVELLSPKGIGAKIKALFNNNWPRLVRSAPKHLRSPVRFLSSIQF